MPASHLLRWIGALALAGLVWSCRAPESGRPLDLKPGTPLAVWSYRDLTGSAPERSAFFDFAARRHISDLYLGAADLLPKKAEALAILLEEAGRRGIRVSLVFGRAAWVRPEQRAAALAAVRAVRDFDLAQARAGGTRLAALQLDVEPHVLPDWGRDSARLSSQFLDLLEAVKPELAGGPPLHAAIPVWWHGRPMKRAGKTRPLSEWVIQLTDGTVLMDYRVRPEGILAGAEGPLASADALGRPVVVGLAVHCDNDPENAVTSFCRKGEGALRKALRQTEGDLARHRQFKGFAIFTYEDWLILRP